MAELTPMDKIQPCLLDRLTDEEPNQQVESRHKRVVSIQKYREGILRDLSWLFNTSCHRDEEGLAEFPEVERSVLNYGIHNLAGVIGEGIDVVEIEKRIYDAIVFFEPRIIKHSLEVKIIDENKDDHEGAISLRFEIVSDLWARPVPEQFFAKTEVDLETGGCVLKS